MLDITFLPVLETAPENKRLCNRGKAMIAQNQTHEANICRLIWLCKVQRKKRPFIINGIG